MEGIACGMAQGKIEELKEAQSDSRMLIKWSTKRPHHGGEGMDFKL